MNTKILSFVISFMILAFNLQAQVWTYKDKILPEAWQNNTDEEYGNAMDMDGNYAVVGADGHDGMRGCAYVLYYNTGTSDWETVARLEASEGEHYDHFGKSVSISGDFIVVGAYENSNNGLIANGALYVFEKPGTGWANMTETAILTVSDSEDYDRFGQSVSIDGERIVSGNANKNLQTGVVYIFDKPAGGWVNAQESYKVTAEAGSQGDYFGWDVSVSGDFIVVSATHYGGGGALYAFELLNQEWTQIAKFYGANFSSGQLGTSVDISNDVIVAGDIDSQRAYVFKKPAGGWADLDETTDQDYVLTPYSGTEISFGQSVSISGDLIVVGDPSNLHGSSQKGAAFIYEKDTGTGGWLSTANARITASDAKDTDAFGIVAASGDKILAGARLHNATGRNSGAVYGFDKPQTTGGWDDADGANEDYKMLPLTYFNNNQERYGIVAIDGNYAVVGAYNYSGSYGAAYVLYYNGATWNTEARLLPDDSHENQNFGASVDIAGDVIVVGAPKDNENGENSGAAYAFVKSGSEWTDMTQTAKLSGSAIGTGERFGYVSIQGDLIAVGAPDDNTDGAVYLFEKPGGGWVDMTEDAILTASDAPGSSIFNFGSNVAHTTSGIAVGASGADVYGTRSGAVYVFEEPGTGWENMTETAKLTPSDGIADGYFGASISTFDDNILIGAFNDNTTENEGGLAYIFEKPGTGWENMNEIVKLLTSDGESGDKAGSSAALEDGYAVIGAPSDSEAEDDHTGSVYIYNKPQAGWETAVESKKIVNPDQDRYDNFGASVGISGDFFIAGVLLDDTSNGVNSGSVYIYESLPHQPIAFIQHPADKTGVCVDDEVTFEVQAENMTDYQWQVSTDGGINFSDLTEGEPYTGTQTHLLNVEATPDSDENMYRCVLSNPDYSADSNSAELLLETENPQISSTYDGETLNADQNCEAVLPDYTAMVSVTDNCDFNPEITQNPVAGTTVSGAVNSVTLTVTDNAGNVSETTFNVEVTDAARPEITSVHEDLDIDADANCQAALPDYTADIIAVDNCDTDLTFSQTPPAETIISGTSNTVTLRAEDQAGNFTETDFNVTVVDNTVPEISCVGDQTIVIDENQTSYTIGGTELDPDYSDNCQVYEIKNDYNNINSLAGVVLPLGETSITWTLTDNAGNTSVCTDLILVSHTSDVNSIDESDIAVYPNPNDGVFTLESDASCRVEITDIGNRVIKEFIHDNETTSIDLSSQPAGLYFIKLTIDKNTVVMKLIKE